jgi:hypothetical protein
MICSSVSRPRCLAVGAAATLGCGALVTWLVPTLTAPDAGTFEAALVRLCAWLAVLAVCGLWLGTTATVLEAVRGRGPRAHGVPAPLRRAVLAACGVALAGGMATGTAYATPGRIHEDRVAGAVAAVADLPLPDRARVRAAPSAPSIVVAPGDSLWTIAAEQLGPDASDAEIDACWRRLYDLNRAAIGPDPDLIHPAQRLEVLP